MRDFITRRTSFNHLLLDQTTKSMNGVIRHIRAEITFRSEGCPRCTM